jgi:hypothetical protein
MVAEPARATWGIDRLRWIRRSIQTVAEPDEHDSAEANESLVPVDTERSREHAFARPSMPARAAHLFALAGFAVAQPLFELLGGQPEFWIARQATTVEIAVLILVVVVLIPGLLVVVDLVVDRLNERAAWVLHLVFVAGFAWLVATVVIDNLTSGDWAPKPILAMAAGVAILFALAYRSVKFVRDFLSILVVGPIVFTLLFVIRLPPLGGYDVPAVDAGLTGDNPVVMVVFDELQLAGVQDENGSIDRTRFPGLAEFADSSTWYRYATTVHDDSLSAVPAILSGTYPEPGKLAIASDYPVNLFTVLGSTHTIVANEELTRLCPPSMCDKDRDESILARFRTLLADTSVVYLHTSVPNRLTYRLPDISGGWGNFLAADGPVGTDAPPGSETDRLNTQTGGEGRALVYGDFLDSIDPSIGSAFYYLHVDLPHPPWTLSPPGKRYPRVGVVGRDSRGYWRKNPWLVQQGYVRTMLQTGFVDQLISDTVTRLKDLGMWDDALVVLLSDHGQNFAVGEPRRAFRDNNLVGMGGVPLLIKYPGQVEGVVDTLNAQTIDVFPTMVTALGGSVSGLDGVPLQNADRPDVKRFLSAGGPEYPTDFASYVAMDDRYRADMLDLAPAGVGFAGVFETVGPRPDLFGRTVDSLSVRDDPGEAELFDRDLFGGYDPAGGIDPIGVQFRVSASSLPDSYAVAVNGTILATIPAYSINGSTASILAIVPPGSFEAGSNDIGLFGIEGDPGATTLVRYR